VTASSSGASPSPSSARDSPSKSHLPDEVRVEVTSCTGATPSAVEDHAGQGAREPKIEVAWNSVVETINDTPRAR